MYKFKFADIGEGLTEGVVGEIFVKVGDTIKEGDNLFAVETDKVATEIPSPVAGKITKILVKTDETIHVGDDAVHFELSEASSNEEKGASVVGEVIVSNKEFSFDKYKK